MGRIAFVFSGQGDQYPGMGKELAARYSVAADVFSVCETLRPGTRRQCFEGSEEELKETASTQPCLFAMEFAAASVLMEKGIVPDACAGFSLGEVVAATVCGWFCLEDGFRLVCRRGELMQQEASRYDCSMAAVIKLSADDVATICSRFPDVYPVNFNCPGQVTVAGASSQMPGFSSAVRAAGGRAIPLKVRGAFHSPFMQAAANAFRRELETVSFGKPTIPLYSDRTAERYGEDAVSLLSEQIASPVQWETLIRNMILAGIDTFIEIGPGQTLTHMIQRIDPLVRTYSVSEMDTLLKEMNGC